MSKKLKINANLRISDGTNDYKTLKELCTKSITAYMSGRQYLQGGNGRTHIPLGSIKPSANDKIKLTDAGSIQILKPIKCLISAQVIVWNSPVISREWDINIYRIRNGTETLIGRAYSSILSTNGLIHHNITPFYAELEEGDYVFLSFLTFEGQQFHILGDDRTTYLTIQEL